MTFQRRMLGLRSLLGLLLIFSLLAACAGDGAETDADEAAAEDEPAEDATSEEPADDATSEEPADGEEAPTGADEIGPPETTELTVGFRFPNGTFYLPQLVAREMGYFEDEGLTLTEITTATDLGAALQGESVDIAMDWPETPYFDAQAGLPVTILSGYLCRTRTAVAVQGDVESVEDLDGKAITLAGTSGDLQANLRRNLLAEEGWDLDTVNVEEVFPGPGSDVWRQFFVNGQIALMPYYVDDEPVLRDYGANFVMDVLTHAPRGVLIARPDFVEENPNTVTRYLRAMIRAHEYIMAPGQGEEPEHRDEMIAMMEAEGFTDPLADHMYAFDQQNMCENLHIGDGTWTRLLELYELDYVDLEEVSMLEPLYAAQASLGYDNAEPIDVTWPPAG